MGFTVVTFRVLDAQGYLVFLYPHPFTTATAAAVASRSWEGTGEGLQIQVGGYESDWVPVDQVQRGAVLMPSQLGVEEEVPIRRNPNPHGSSLAWHDSERPVYIGVRKSDGMVKIGMASDPLARCSDLGLVLVATEPGGAQREKEVHQLLAASSVPRTGRRGPSTEWFRPDPPVWDYVNSVRAASGLGRLVWSRELS